MYISSVYNKTLLNLIIENENISVNDLKEQYCSPKQGYLPISETHFQKDLNTLINLGYITYNKDKDIVSYLQH